jgi:hypothetical protein
MVKTEGQEFHWFPKTQNHNNHTQYAPWGPDSERYFAQQI